MKKKQFGKCLTQKFVDWRAEDWRKTAADFAREVGCPPQNMGRWLDGKSLPDLKYISMLAKVMPEIYEIMEMTPASGVEPRIPSKFTASWRKMPPELQRETEEFFGTITAEEFAELILDVIRIRRERGKGDADAPDDDAPDEAAASSQRTKGRKQARLRPSGGTA